MFGDCFGTKIPDSGQILPAGCFLGFGAGFAFGGAVFLSAAGFLAGAGFFAADFFAGAFFAGRLLAPPSSATAFRAGLVAFFAAPSSAAFFAVAFATGFLAVAFFTLDFFAGAAFLVAAVRPDGFAELVRFAAFAGVPDFFAGTACFDPTRAGAFLAAVAGTFRALVDLPVAFAIGRSLRSCAPPDGESGGC